MIDRYFLTTILALVLFAFGFGFMIAALSGLAWILLIAAVVFGAIAFIQALNEPKSTRAKPWPPKKEKTA